MSRSVEVKIKGDAGALVRAVAELQRSIRRLRWSLVIVIGAVYLLAFALLLEAIL